MLGAAKAFIALLPDDEQVSLEAQAALDAESADVVEAPAGQVAESMDNSVGAPEENISGYVLAAVEAVGGSPKAPAIRQWIAKNNPAIETKLLANPAYLYTVLTRHVVAGRLAKRGKRYRLPSSSPKGEAGGVAPPADSVTSPSTTCGPSQAAPEAGGT